MRGLRFSSHTISGCCVAKEKTKSQETDSIYCPVFQMKKLFQITSVGRVWAFCGILFSAALSTQCANQGTPTGGVKDTIAPMVVKTSPENKSRNFSGDQISFTFDEYVQTENLQQELIVTPDLGNEYESKPTKYGVVLKFRKPFQANTTYTLNFRSAIKDISEKNVARDAKLVFSTGQALDTLSIAGRVTDLETGKPEENAVVSLYRADDTLDIKKNKPYYFTKTDKLGRYALENLRQGEYRLYALAEKDNNQRYNQDEEKIAFLTQNLVLRDSSREGLNLKVSIVDELPPKVARRTTQSDLYNIEMNEGLTEVNVQHTDTTRPLAFALDAKDPKIIRLFNTIQQYDSLTVKVTARDSSDNVSESNVRIKFEKLDEKKRARKTKIPFEIATEPNGNEPVLRQLAYRIQFSKPVTRFDLSKVQLLADTLTPIVLDVRKDFQWNKSFTQLRLDKTVDVKRRVRFVAPKETFFSVEGDTAAAIKNTHEIKDPEKYGSIGGRVTTTAKHYIIQLLDNGGKVIAQIRNQPRYNFQYLPAGEYNLRVIIDRNNNGKWDAASFINRTAAEDITYGFEKRKLKENWELTDQNVQLQ